MLLLLTLLLADVDGDAAWLKDVPVAGQAAADAVPRMLRIAEDTAQPEGLRVQALLKLGRIDAAATQTGRLVTIAKDATPVGNAALKALTQLGPAVPGAVRLYLAILDDEDAEQQRRLLAAEGIVRLASVSPAAMTRVAAMLDAEHPLVRWTLIFLWREPPSVARAVRPLLERLATGPDAELAEKVVPLLGQFRDERGADLLFELAAAEALAGRPVAAATELLLDPVFGPDRIRRLLASGPPIGRETLTVIPSEQLATYRDAIAGQLLSDDRQTRESAAVVLALNASTAADSQNAVAIVSSMLTDPAGPNRQLVRSLMRWPWPIPEPMLVELRRLQADPDLTAEARRTARAVLDWEQAKQEPFRPN